MTTQKNAFCSLPQLHMADMATLPGCQIIDFTPRTSSHLTRLDLAIHPRHSIHRISQNNDTILLSIINYYLSRTIMNLHVPKLGHPKPTIHELSLQNRLHWFWVDLGVHGCPCFVTDPILQISVFHHAARVRAMQRASLDCVADPWRFRSVGLIFKMAMRKGLGKGSCFLTS